VNAHRLHPISGRIVAISIGHQCNLDGLRDFFVTPILKIPSQHRSLILLLTLSQVAGVGNLEISGFLVDHTDG
jgi:hypothetical protein